MIRVRVTMELDCPGMDEAEAVAHTIATAEAAGFAECLPTLGEKGHTTPRNWWRELVTQTYSDARCAWEAERERATFLYETEMREWEEQNPAPTIKDTMRGMKGCAA